ncbi:hypothetical protein F3Y22_tig00110458pilonHSYRG00438 [Hibiscus syriacus]|uniref:HAT C-terminal dimerisation domain-containing protein n=1 Tax=Hibiscus syriacus TaxID=106335 RepID=A0A6A3AJP0_HIBSY|nr:hypothetical protein F3Y22_tig00110458pilonHSYRG00438 [Hibiscus syriacus]
MAFGQNHRRDSEYDENEIGISETQGYIDLDDDVQQTTTASEGSGSGSHSEKVTEKKDPIKPLLDEVTLIGAGNSKNAGGDKQWICKHYKGKYTSSYTRIHVHFFGAPLGKKAEIRRCPVVAKDRDTYERLQKRVKDAEKLGVSKSLKSSIVTKRHNLSSKKLLEQSFSIMERSAIDLKIVRALCANGILFNVLRNPQFCEMINAIRKAPEGYKAPSSEKARTVLPDECVRDVENDLTPFKDTCCGSMFMYAEDFFGVEKTGKAISEFLIQAIESVGPSNVLSVVTDNATNFKLAGKEIEKRLNTCREALSTTIALNSWRYWEKQGDEHTRTIAQLVVDTIRDDDFWNEVENILKITKPIFLMVKFCDGEGPKMGKIYEKMDNMIGEIKDVMKESVMEAFSRIAENRDEERMLREQFAMFHMKKGLYSLHATQLDTITMEAIDWWSTYGAETPKLAEVAKKILSQPISSSSAERNWSTYSYIHSVKRNRLNYKRADKLVYVHFNIRLSLRFSEAYKEGPHKKWDMDLESTNLESSRIEDMVWEDLEEDEDNDNGKGKKKVE